MRRLAIYGAMGLLAVTLAAAQTPVTPAQTPAPKKDCGKKKDCPAVPAPNADNHTDSQALPGTDADVPGEPAAAPKSQGNALPGADADAPGEAPSAPAPQKSAGKDKLPGDDADVPGEEPPPSHAPSSSSSSSGSDGFSSSRNPEMEAPPAPTDQDGDSPVKASPLKDLGSGGEVSVDRKKLEAHRVQDDLKVAHFYENDGNLMGAYLRYKDAVGHDPEQDEAQWGWAQMAEKLKKPDEAREHYEAYLNLDASGKHAKDAREALERLSATAGKK